jgi:hypothetical protein
VNWLANCRLFYWGDVDVHGFHILSRLRGTFPNIISVMMDEATLDTFARFIVTASESPNENISHLTMEESQPYRRAKAGKLLLEQEKIPHLQASPLLASMLSCHGGLLTDAKERPSIGRARTELDMEDHANVLVHRYWRDSRAFRVPRAMIASPSVPLQPGTPIKKIKKTLARPEVSGIFTLHFRLKATMAAFWRDR